MAARIARMFTTHPETVGETYLGHMAFAAWFSSRLFLAGGAALLHAVFPFLCDQPHRSPTGRAHAQPRQPALDDFAGSITWQAIAASYPAGLTSIDMCLI